MRKSPLATSYDTLRTRLESKGYTALAVRAPEALLAALDVARDIVAYEGDTKRPDVAAMLRLKFAARGMTKHVSEEELAALVAAIGTGKA